MNITSTDWSFLLLLFHVNMLKFLSRQTLDNGKLEKKGNVNKRREEIR